MERPPVCRPRRGPNGPPAQGIYTRASAGRRENGAVRRRGPRRRAPASAPPSCAAPSGGRSARGRARPVASHTSALTRTWPPLAVSHTRAATLTTWPATSSLVTTASPMWTPARRRSGRRRGVEEVEGGADPVGRLREGAQQAVAEMLDHPAVPLAHQGRARARCSPISARAAASPVGVGVGREPLEVGEDHRHHLLACRPPSPSLPEESSCTALRPSEDSLDGWFSTVRSRKRRSMSVGRARRDGPFPGRIEPLLVDQPDLERGGGVVGVAPDHGGRLARRGPAQRGQCGRAGLARLARLAARPSRRKVITVRASAAPGRPGHGREAPPGASGPPRSSRRRSWDTRSSVPR